MASRNYFSQTTPEGVRWDQREIAAGYPSPGGENIDSGYSSVDQLVQHWMSSDSERRNVLNCGFTTMGAGLDTRGGWYWTADFGR